MSDSALTREAPAANRTNGSPGSAQAADLDWAAAARTPEFKELVRRRRRFVVPATIFFLAWYFGFIVLAGYAPDFMGEEFLADGLTVGYVLALSQFVMTWGLAWAGTCASPTASSTRLLSGQRKGARGRRSAHGEPAASAASA